MNQSLIPPGAHRRLSSRLCFPQCCLCPLLKRFLGATGSARKVDHIYRLCKPSLSRTRLPVKGDFGRCSAPQRNLKPLLAAPKPQIHRPKLPDVEGQPWNSMTHRIKYQTAEQACLHHPDKGNKNPSQSFQRLWTSAG